MSTDYEQRIRAYVDAHPTMSDRRLADKIVAATPPSDYREILVALTVWEVAAAKRVRARKVEDDARAAWNEDDDLEDDEDTEPDNVGPIRQNAPPPEDFQRLYDDPALWNVPGRLLGVAAAYGGNGVHWFERETDDEFRRWCAATHGDGAFDGWLDRAILAIADDPIGWESDKWSSWPRFARHWLSGYVDQIEENQRRKEREENSERMRNDLARIMQQHADKIRFEVTSELLDNIFATGDGTRVTWRDATVLQHEDRIDLLSKMVAGTTETAAMHIRAVRMIKDAGVDTLGQLAGG